MAGALLALFRFTPARPALGAGVRAGLAGALPLLVGAAFSPQTVSWVSLGGFQTSTNDKGGAYPARARRLLTVASCSALACVAGSLAGNLGWLALPIAFAWLLAWGLLRVLGNTATAAGSVASNSFFIALARPTPDPFDALAAGAAVLAGGALGTLLAVFLWPLRLYRPARMAVKACYAQLAGLLRLLATEKPRYRDRAAARAALRSQVEEARRILGETRIGRQVEGERGERLLRLIENADQLLGTCIAIDGWSDRARAEERRALVPTLEAAAEAADGIAAAVVDRRAPLAKISLEPRDGLPFLWRLARDLEAAAEAVEELREGREGGEAPARPAERRVARPRRQGAFARLRSVLDRRSVILRHALRLATAGAIAHAAARLLAIEHAYWVTLTTIVVLQPVGGATFERGLQRIGGTALGAVLAIVAVDLVHTRIGFAAIVFLFCAASVAILPLSYGVFSVFLTPAFVLVAELGTGDFELAWFRVLDTLLGGAIALFAAATLWPSWERHRFPDELAAALRASAAWVRTMGREGAESPAAEEKRRQVGIALVNAEASLQRLLTEAWRSAGRVEPFLAVILYLRRFHGSALSLFVDPALAPARRERIAAEAASLLEAIAAAVARSEPPPAAPAPLARLAQEGPDVAPLVRQLSVVHGASTRGFGPGGLGAPAPAR